MQLLQNFLLQCMMLHSMHLQQTTGDLMFIHITTGRLNWTTDNTFRVLAANYYNENWNNYVSRQYFYYPYINNFGFYFYGYGYSDGMYMRGGRNGDVMYKMDAPMPVSESLDELSVQGIVGEEKESGKTSSTT